MSIAQHFPRERTYATPIATDLLLRMADAATVAVECMATLNNAGCNLITEALKGHGKFTEWNHFPPADVYDPVSHSQYYFHAHPPSDRTDPDYGHFHTFLRLRGVPAGIHPVDSKDFVGSAGERDDVCQLIAISMNRAGLPERLFTTNRWVTGETWYKAADVIAMLDRFSIDLLDPSPTLNRWLTAMLVVFRPQIEKLIMDRDAAIERWRSLHPETNVFEDREIEITSSLEASLYRQVEWLDEMLDTATGD